VADSAGNVTERWYETPGLGGYRPRLWLRLLFQKALNAAWLLSTGVEGDRPARWSFR